MAISRSSADHGVFRVSSPSQLVPPFEMWHGFCGWGLLLCHGAASSRVLADETCTGGRTALPVVEYLVWFGGDAAVVCGGLAVGGGDATCLKEEDCSGDAANSDGRG